MDKEIELIHVFYGENQYKDRRSFVFLDHKSRDYVIMCLSESESSNFITRISGHSERYAEDAGENWVLGVIKPVNSAWSEKTVEQDKYF